MKKITIFALVFIIALSACNVSAKVPKGCPEKTSIIVTSKEFGNTKFDKITPWYIEDQKVLDIGIRYGILYFLNYENFDPNYPDAFWHAYKDLERTLTIGIKNLDNSEKISTGVWPDVHGKKIADAFIYSSSEDPGKNIGMQIIEPSHVEITYFGQDYVCGKAQISNTHFDIKGDFIANYKKLL